MNKLQKIILILLIPFGLSAQNVGIGTNTPDASSALEISDTNKGILIPRTDTSNVTGPATGLLIYQSSDNRFYFYDGSHWKNVGESGQMLSDTDGDTRIEVEESTDSDVINFYRNDTLRMRLVQDRLELFGDRTGNVFIGTGAGENLDDDNPTSIRAINNTFVGDSCGYSNTTGFGNSFYGRSSGVSNTTGQSNSFYGLNSGYSNTTGFGNSFYGRRSGFSNTTGTYNSFYGVCSGENNTTGFSNSFYGLNSGYSNTTGSENSFYGRSSGYNNTTGSNNSFYGRFSGFSNTTGSYNSFYGRLSGNDNTTGTYNSFYGRNSGYSNTTGSDNSFYGQNSGLLYITQNRNTFIGVNTGGTSPSPSDHDNVFIGYRAGNHNINYNNTLIIANDERTDPLILGNFLEEKLTIHGDQHVRFSGGDGDVDGFRLQNQSGTNAWWNFHVQSASGDLMLYASDNSTDGDRRFVIEKSGQVAIGDISNPGYDLTLQNNSAAKPGSSSWTISSDARLKKDVHAFEGGLNLIQDINPVWFTYNGKAGMPQETYVGTIAQELQRTAPFMVKEWTYEDDEGVKEDYLAVDYGAMDFVLVNAIKEQQETIDELASRLEEMAKINDKMAKENEALKNKMNAFFSKLQSEQ